MTQMQKLVPRCVTCLRLPNRLYKNHNPWSPSKLLSRRPPTPAKTTVVIHKLLEPNSLSDTQARNDCEHPHHHHPKLLSPITNGGFRIKPPLALPTTFHWHPVYFPTLTH